MKNIIRNDFPPLYYFIFLFSCAFIIFWGFLLIGGYDVAIIELPSTTPLITVSWLVIALHLFLSIITFTGILKHADLRIEYYNLKENSENSYYNLVRIIEEKELKIEELEAKISEIEQDF